MKSTGSVWIENADEDPSTGDWGYVFDGMIWTRVMIIGHSQQNVIEGHKIIAKASAGHVSPFRIFNSPEAQEVLGEMHELYF